MENWKRIHPDTHTPLRGTLYSLEPSPRARPPTRAARRERGQRESRAACGAGASVSVRFPRLHDSTPRETRPSPRARLGQTARARRAAHMAHGRSMLCMDAQTGRREWRDPRPDRESGAGRGPRARCRAVPTAHPTDSVRHRRGPQAHSSATLERNYYRTRAAAGRRRIQKCRIPERTRTLPPPRRATNRITGSGISLSRFSRHRRRYIIYYT